MKTKTIKKIVASKIEGWIDTIQDPKLQKSVRRDVIVTGGCIASMLLSEKVNDFDLYFKTKETVIRLCEYYTKGTKVETVHSGNLEDFKSLHLRKGPGMEQHIKESGSQVAVFIRNMTKGVEDRVKLYIPSTGFYRLEDKEILDNIKEDEYIPVFISENAISLSNQVQLIIRFFGTPHEVHLNYDFVHATNYVHMDKETHRWELVTNKEALTSLLTKELRYIGSKYPVTSVIRSKKFLMRGFTISAGTYLKILFQVSQLDLTNIDTLQEQLVGVDIAYFDTLIQILKDVPEGKLTYQYVSEIIDRVFDGGEETE